MSVFVLFLYFIFLCNSCISFNLQPVKDTKAKGIIFEAPASPYIKVKKTGIEDISWENPQNKHKLSFFSNCSATNKFTTLKKLQTELLVDLKNFRILNQKQMMHQNQKAYYVSLNKKVNKTKKTSIDLFLFKKKHCFYALSFIKPIVQKNESSNIPKFNKFIREFKAP